MSQPLVLTEVIREWSAVFMRRSGRDFRGFMEETGLSFSQINILMRLYHGGNHGVSEIGERLGITNAAASQSIDQLVNLGLITRNEDPKDRRAKQLGLTPQGRELVEKGVEARVKWVEGLTEALSPAQQDMIVTALTLLTGAARKIED
jgi:MarR family transcriptional regulator, organic hydroperoxide resistance regulator